MMKKFLILLVCLLPITSFAGPYSPLPGGPASGDQIVVERNGVYYSYDPSDFSSASLSFSSSVMTLLNSATYTEFRTNLGLGSAALLNVGDSPGDVVAWENDGSGNSVLQIGIINLLSMSSFYANGVSFDANSDGKIDSALLDASATGGASSLAELSDWPTSVTATEVSYLDGTTSNLQNQINTLTSAFNALNDSFSGTNPPVLLSAILGTDGETLTLGFNEVVNIGSGGSGGWDVDASTTGTDISATYSSGDGTTSLVYTLGSTVRDAETVDVDYTQPGDGIEDNDGTDLTSISSASVINNSTYSGPAYIVSADFEETGTPAGWTASGYSGGAVNFDYTPAISGSQSCRLWNTGTGYYSVVTPQFTGSSGGNYFAMKINHHIVPAGNLTFVKFLDASSNDLGGISWRYGTSYLAAAPTGGSLVTSSTAMDLDTDYWIMARYIPGTGANAVITVWLSTNGSTWTQLATSTNGTTTANAAYVKIENNMGPDMGFIIDDARVSTNEITY